MKTRDTMVYFYGLTVALCMIAIMLSGCQEMPSQASQTFNQRIATGNALVGTIADSIPILGEAGKLTPEDAQNVLDQAKNLKSGLDIAVSLHGPQPGAAEDRLTAVMAALTALNDYLKTKGAP